MKLTGVQIRMARAALGWSVRDLAEDARLHRNTVTNIETGKYAGGSDTLDQIQDVFEGAGLEFIWDNSGGVGVMQRKP